MKLLTRVKKLEGREPKIELVDDDGNTYVEHVGVGFTLLTVAGQILRCRRDGQDERALHIPEHVRHLVPTLDTGLRECGPGDGQLVRAASLLLMSERLHGAE